MRRMKGQRPESGRFEYRGEHYQEDTSTEGRYRCTFHSTLWRCEAAAYQLEDGTFRMSGVHFHGPPHEYEDRQTLTEALKERPIIEIEEAPGVVVDEVFRKHRPIADLMSRPTARKAVSRERVRFQNKIPDTMNGLGDMLRNFIPADAIFRDHLTVTDESLITIFASPQMISRLNDGVELHVDGTFKSIPDHPRSAQLFIISMRKMDMGMPAVFVLCSHRTIATYNRLWEYLLEQAPGMRRNLRTVVSDFEPAIVSCVPRTMP